MLSASSTIAMHRPRSKRPLAAVAGASARSRDCNGVARPVEAVAQVVEDEFLRGAVGDVAGVGDARAVRPPAACVTAPTRQTQRAIERPQRFGVARDQVVVGGDDVHGDAGERGGRGRQRYRERLAFAGRHLREPIVEHDARRR